MNANVCKHSFWHNAGMRVAIALVFVIAPTVPVGAQVESGKVVGAVHDASGALLAGAKIMITNVDTNVSRSVVAGSSGEYVVTELPPGTYTMLAEHEGFKKAAQARFKLDVNQVTRIDFTLSVGSVNETVTVMAAEPLVESQTSSLGQVVEEHRVHDLPLNGRNFVELSYLTPGVNSGPTAGLTVQQGNIPENQRGTAAIQANGLTATNNNFLLNGFDNNEQQIGIEVIQPSIDAIQEFKVQTNSFGADIGRGGAVVNVVLKSGTNQLHGSAYEFVRNSYFDAKNYFDSASQAIAPFKQNQFGATLGGPLIKNRTFFFGDYQGTRIRKAQTVISTVPVLAERTGDFSDLLTGTIDPNTGFDTGQIFDPLTMVGGQRQPFGNNVIPACAGNTGRSATGGGCLDPAALNLVNLYPTPNLPGAANNFLFNPVSSNNQDSFDIRVDHQVSSKNNLFGIFSYGNVNAHAPDPFPGEAGGGNFSGNITNLARAAGISDVHAFSPALINEFKIGYSRYVVQALPNFAGQPISSQVGIPNIFNPNDPLATGGLPYISFPDLSAIGTTDWFPEFLRENNYQYADSLTYVRGRHAFKMGVDVRRRLHGFFQTQNARGDMSFDQQFTENLVDFTGGSSLASFLLGYPITAYRDGQKGTFGMRWWEVSAYFMEDYRVTPKLTLNLGLRYDIFTPPVEQQNRLANFDFFSGKFISPQVPGVSASGNVKTDYNNFAPRIGFAWTPWNEKTVLRGGYGIFYDVQADQNDAELAYNPTGLFFSQSFISPATSPNLQISLSQGYPTPVFPAISNPSGRASASLFNNRTTYIEEWNLDIERSLLRDAVLQIAYVGTHGVNLSYLSNQNQPVLPLDTNFQLLDTTTLQPCSSGATCQPSNFGRPYSLSVPNIGAIRTLQNRANSISHGMQVKFEKRLSSSWSMLNSYTWQHTIGQTEEDEYYEPQNTHDPAAERGDNAPDFRHQFSSAFSYILPFGPGKRFLASEGRLRWLAGGWQVNGIIAAHSGEAFTPILSFDPTNTNSGAPRPDIVGDPYNFSDAVSLGCPSNHQSIQCWYNPGAFAIPALAPGQTFAHLFGDARRGSLRGPAVYNIDASVFKNFPLRESWNLEFRAEAFNLFNTPEFSLPNGSTDQIGSPGSPGLAGSITSTVHDSRQLQFALKLTF
jgi:Carboxypeptidase regulatory-like domain